MKTALIFFRQANEFLGAENIVETVNLLQGGGVVCDSVVLLDYSDDIGFKRNLNEFKDTVDNLIIFGGEKARFSVKDMICESAETVLVENESAKSFLDAVRNLGVSDCFQEYAMLPVEATVIPNIIGGFQGFVLDIEEFSITMLPSSFNEHKPMCEKYLLPYLEKKYDIKIKRLTLKYFGESKILYQTLLNAEQTYVNAFRYVISEKHGDFTVNLTFLGDDEFIYKDVVRFIVSALKDNIYAECDTTLSERLFDILKLKNLKISVAESFTAGRIVSSIISNSGASNYVHEGIVAYSNESKYSRLNVVNADLKRDGAVSSVVAYQMAAGLIKTGDCDVAISTTGIAGPKSDDTKKPVGLCYIGVGKKDGVHTYKYNFTGTREEITETAKNTALFLAIKNLKNT